jgi:AcrR family transcriptional regulator
MFAIVLRPMSAEIRQLPRGRHRLTREQVLASQRGRMLAAVAEAVAAKGFANISVADVISRAGVSRETFYEQFADKEQCFLEALDAGAGGLLEILQAALSLPAPDPIARMERVLSAYFEALAAEPDWTKAFLVDAYGAGPRAIDRRVELQTRFVEVVAEIVGASGEQERFACEALVAAISSMVTVRVAAGRFDQLAGLGAPIIELARAMPVASSKSALRKRARR